MTYDKITYEGVDIEYEIKRSKRKTFGIKIDFDGKIRVASPNRVGLNVIREMVRKKGKWIISKKTLVDDITKMKSKKEYNQGEVFMYLGEDLCLKVLETESKSSLLLEGDTLMVNLDKKLDESKKKEVIKDLLIEWYKSKALEYLTMRVTYYEKQMGLSSKDIIVKTYKSRWGCCTHDNLLKFNWKIIMAPKDIIDYLVVHELSHIKVKNHSSEFWDTVKVILPDYKKHRTWLKRKGILLDI